MRYLAIILLIIAFSNCRKGTGPGSGPLNPKYKDTLKFEILGLHDTIAEQVDTIDFPVNVKYLAGDKDYVSLSVSNLQFTMTAALIPQIDTPDFFSVVRIVMNNADTGTYNIKVTGSSSLKDKNYNISIHVVPNPVNPAAILTGKYLESGSCSLSGNVNDTVTVTTVGPGFNKINLRGLWSGGTNYNVIANVDPVNQTINIPGQMVIQSFSREAVLT
jgi:hypothetical protein